MPFPRFRRSASRSRARLSFEEAAVSKAEALAVAAPGSGGSRSSRLPLWSDRTRRERPILTAWRSFRSRPKPQPPDRLRSLEPRQASILEPPDLRAAGQALLPSDPSATSNCRRTCRPSAAGPSARRASPSRLGSFATLRSRRTPIPPPPDRIEDRNLLLRPVSDAVRPKPRRLRLLSKKLGARALRLIFQEEVLAEARKLRPGPCRATPKSGRFPIPSRSGIGLTFQKSAPCGSPSCPDQPASLALPVFRFRFVPAALEAPSLSASENPAFLWGSD